MMHQWNFLRYCERCGMSKLVAVMTRSGCRGEINMVRGYAVRLGGVDVSEAKTIVHIDAITNQRCLPVTLAGLEIIVDPYLCKSRQWRQVRFPRSRKKRIRNKWAKDRRNFGVVDIETAAYEWDGKIIMGPKTYRALCREIERRHRAKQAR